MQSTTMTNGSNWRFAATLGRAPTADERADRRQVLTPLATAQSNDEDAWTALFHALFASVDFRYRELRIRTLHVPSFTRFPAASFSPPAAAASARLALSALAARRRGCRRRP